MLAHEEAKTICTTATTRTITAKKKQNTHTTLIIRWARVWLFNTTKTNAILNCIHCKTDSFNNPACVTPKCVHPIVCILGNFRLNTHFTSSVFNCTGPQNIDRQLNIYA